MNHKKPGLEGTSNHLAGVALSVFRQVVPLAFAVFVCAISPSVIVGQNCVPPLSLSCEGAHVFCSPEEMHGYTCQNTSLLNTQGPTPLCPFGGVPNNISWWAFVAGDNVIELEINAFNCTVVQGQNGAQAGIYGDCQFIESVACMPECFTGKAILSGPTVPCKVYYVFVDGCNGSVCEFTVEVIKGMSPPAMDKDPILEVKRNSCLGEMVCATASIPGGCATDFVWTLNGINSQQSGNVWCNAFQTQGSYELCAKGILGSQNNICQESDQVCVTIEVEGLPTIEHPSEIVCYEDRNGLLFLECATPVPSTPGTHRICCQTVKPNGCIQEVCKEFHVQFPVEPQAERKIYCERQRVTLPDGRRINECGNYFINIPGGDKNGCDSSAIWEIIYLEPELKFQSPECNNESYCIEVEANIPCLNESIRYNQYWLNRRTKDTVSFNSAQLCIREPGQYCYVIQMLGNFEFCGLYTYCYNFPNSNWVEWSGLDTVCNSNVHIEKISYSGEDIPDSYQWTIDGGTIIEQPTDTTITWIAGENTSHVRICAQASQGKCRLLDTCVVRTVLSLPSGDFKWNQEGFQLIFKAKDIGEGDSEWLIGGDKYTGDSIAIDLYKNQVIQVKHQRSNKCGSSEKAAAVPFRSERVTVKMSEPELTKLIVQPFDNDLNIRSRQLPIGNYTAVVVDRWGRIIARDNWRVENDLPQYLNMQTNFQVPGLYYLVLTNNENKFLLTQPFVWIP
jgi:hypothetical protein